LAQIAGPASRSKHCEKAADILSAPRAGLKVICDRLGRDAVCLPARAESKVVSNQDPSSTSNERQKRRSDENVRPISDRGVAIFFAVLVAILVLGYLLMTKLADDSRAENCMMEHRKNCGAIEWPSK
jgi:hypothetical protein